MAYSKEDEDVSVHANPTGVLTPDSVRSDADADRVAFLSSFSPEEDKAIMRKVDKRFLLLIGLMYIIKNVGHRLIDDILYTDKDHCRLITPMPQVLKCSKSASLRTF